MKSEEYKKIIQKVAEVSLISAQNYEEDKGNGFEKESKDKQMISAMNFISLFYEEMRIQTVDEIRKLINK